MNSNKNNEYIDLLEIAKDLWAYKFLLISLAVIMAVLSVIRVEFFTKDRYVAYGIVYVSNGEAMESDEVSKTAIETSRSMVETCREILKTRTFLTEVSLGMGGKYSWSQISGMTSINAVNETELMRISVTAYNPQDAYLIADGIVNRAPERLVGIFKSGTAEIIDEVIMPGGPVGKGTARQGVVGAIVGFMLGAAIVVIKNLFDEKVRKAEDVAKRYNVSILGEIAQ